MILFGIAWAIGTPIVAIVALVRSGNVRAENLRLAGEIAALRRQVEQGVVPRCPRSPSLRPRPSTRLSRPHPNLSRPNLSRPSRSRRTCRPRSTPQRRRPRAGVRGAAAVRGRAARRRLGAPARLACLHLGRRRHARVVGDLPRPLLDRGGISLARGAGDPGRAVRLRADRRRREDKVARRAGSAGPGRGRHRGGLRRAVLGGRAVRHDFQGRGRRRRDGVDRLRHRRVAAARHPRRRARPSSAASRAPPSSAARRPTRRCCSAICWRSPPARWR